MNNNESNSSFALAEDRLRVAPSLLAADFSRLAEQVRIIEDAGAEVLHLDVMDGHFVPNISFGPGVIAAIRNKSKMFFDTHLMIDEPARYAESFAKAGSDLITFHIETTDNPSAVINEIRRCGCFVGVSLNPTTSMANIECILPDIDLILVMSVWPGFGGQQFMPEVLGKVAQIKERLRSDQRLEIDGGIDSETICDAVAAGADTIVAGTAIFGQDDPVAAWSDLERLANTARIQRQ